jgi:hypothetical protein
MGIKMSFQIGFDPAELWAARAIDKVRRAVLDAYLVARKTKGTRKKDLAKKLGKDPAQITRWLTRPEQLSIKSLGYLAYALECDVKVELVALYDQKATVAGSNRPNWCDLGVDQSSAAAISTLPASGNAPAGGNAKPRTPALIAA